MKVRIGLHNLAVMADQFKGLLTKAHSSYYNFHASILVPLLSELFAAGVSGIVAGYIIPGRLEYIREVREFTGGKTEPWDIRIDAADIIQLVFMDPVPMGTQWSTAVVLEIDELDDVCAIVKQFNRYPDIYRASLHSRLQHLLRAETILYNNFVKKGALHPCLTFEGSHLAGTL
jgi:hypothetical protein